MESLGDDAAETSTDVGHEMQPQEDEVVNNAPDKEDGNLYGEIKDTDSSI